MVDDVHVFGANLEEHISLTHMKPFNVGFLKLCENK